MSRAAPARVAELFGRFGAKDRVGDCRHSNDAGYDKLTQAFLDVLIRARR